MTSSFLSTHSDGSDVGRLRAARVLVYELDECTRTIAMLSVNSDLLRALVRTNDDCVHKAAVAGRVEVLQLISAVCTKLNAQPLSSVHRFHLRT